MASQHQPCDVLSVPWVIKHVKSETEAALLLELDSSVTLLESLIEVYRRHPHAAEESSQPRAQPDHHLQSLAERMSGISSTIKRLRVPLAAYQDGHAATATELRAIHGCTAPAQLHNELARAEHMLLQHADDACNAASQLHLAPPETITPPPCTLQTTPVRTPRRISASLGTPTSVSAVRMPRLFPPSLPEGLFDANLRHVVPTTAPVFNVQSGSLSGSLPGSLPTAPLMTTTSLLQPSILGLSASPTAPRVIALPTGQSVVNVGQSPTPQLLLRVATPHSSSVGLPANCMAVQLLRTESLPDKSTPGGASAPIPVAARAAAEDMPPPKKPKMVHAANSSTSDTTPTAGGGVGEPAMVDAVESPAVVAPAAIATA